MARQGVALPTSGEYGVGMVFLKKLHHVMRVWKRLSDRLPLKASVCFGWRDVPVNSDMPMSPLVRATEPVIRRAFVGRGPDVFVTDAFERKLYIIRRRAANAIKSLKLKHGQEFYVPSFSARTINYKGLLLADQVGVYFTDLEDKRTVSALALVHQRFSTNTFPTWDLASVPLYCT